AATAEGARDHGIHPAPEITDRLSVVEEAAMIDLATYVLEPLHQEGACLLSRGQLQGQRAGMVPSLLVVAPVGDHPTPATRPPPPGRASSGWNTNPPPGRRSPPPGPCGRWRSSSTRGGLCWCWRTRGASRSRASWVVRWRCRRGCASPSGSRWR